MTSRPRSGAVRLAAPALAAMLVTGCTGGSTGPSGAPSSTGAPSGTPGGQATATLPPAASLSAVPYASLAASPPAPIGSATATPRFTTRPVTVEVLAVRAGKDVTALEFRLSTSTPFDNVNPQMLQREGSGTPDVGGVVLVATQANQRLFPLYAGAQACLCSWMPRDLGPGGVYLQATYPVLPASVTTVEVAAPGFPPITVPVTRA